MKLILSVQKPQPGVVDSKIYYTHCQQYLRSCQSFSPRELAVDLNSFLPFSVVGSSSSALSPGSERLISMGFSELNIIECVIYSFSFWTTSLEHNSLRWPTSGHPQVLWHVQCM